MTITDPAVPTPLELHRPPETWVTIKDAAKAVADGESLIKVERRIRFWAKDASKDGEPPVVRWKQEGARNSPLLVVLEDVQEAVATRAEREHDRPMDLLPVPVEVMDDLRAMKDQLIVSESARARAEAISEFRESRMAEMRDEKAKLEQQLIEATTRRRGWFRR